MKNYILEKIVRAENRLKMDGKALFKRKRKGAFFIEQAVVIIIIVVLGGLLIVAMKDLFTELLKLIQDKLKDLFS